MSDSKQGVSVKPVVCLVGRHLSKEELKYFYKYFKNVLVVNNLTFNKKVIELTSDDVVLCPLDKQIGRDWFSCNNKYLQDNVDNTVWMRNAGDSTDDEEFLKEVKYENKRLHGDYADKSSFMHDLFSRNTTPKIQSRKMKFLKKVLGLCFGN
jgi:hypothetical protein